MIRPVDSKLGHTSVTFQADFVPNDIIDNHASDPYQSFTTPAIKRMWNLPGKMNCKRKNYQVVYLSVKTSPLTISRKLRQKARVIENTGLLGITQPAGSLLYLALFLAEKATKNVYNYPRIISKKIAEGTLGISRPCKLPYSNTILPHWIICDYAFSLKPYLMNPFAGRCIGTMPSEERIFNYRYV